MACESALQVHATTDPGSNNPIVAEASEEYERGRLPGARSRPQRTGTTAALLRGAGEMNRRPVRIPFTTPYGRRCASPPRRDRGDGNCRADERLARAAPSAHDHLACPAGNARGRHSLDH